MDFKVGDTVKIVKNGNEDCPIKDKYIGKIGEVVEINEDRPSPISVNVEGIGSDGFWEEEMEKV